MINGISQCSKCGGAVFHSTETMTVPGNVVHVCNPGEVELTEAMQRDKAHREAVEDVGRKAHDASVHWTHLRCENPQMLLPIKFVEAMMELDAAVEAELLAKRAIDNAKDQSSGSSTAKQ